MSRQRLERGEKVFLYSTVYIPVDSMIMDQPVAGAFDPQSIVEMGLNGWELVQSIPKTAGVALTNKYQQAFGSTTWGGGLGGNVLGVYLIFKKAVSTIDTVSRDDEVARFVIANNL